MSLANELIKLRGGSAYIVSVLDEQVLLEANKERPLEYRRGKVYPSEVVGKFCPRAWVLCNNDLKLYRNKKVSIDLQHKFNVGHALHDMVQEKLGNAGVLFGRWRCIRCKMSWLGFKPKSKDRRQGTCIDGEHLWAFEELRIRDDSLSIRGRTDGLVRLHGKGKFLFEFKTMRNDDFVQLMEPDEKSVEQALMYLDLAETKMQTQWINDLLNKKSNVASIEMLSKELEFLNEKFNGVLILYMNKDTQDRREFLLTWNDKWRNVIEEKRKKIEIAQKHYAEGTLPERICVAKDDAMAKRCLARVPCFEK